LTEPIGVAVIGAGPWGASLTRAVIATPALRLAYLCDIDETRARRVLDGYSTVRTAGSLDRVLDDRAVQAVVVATPAASHLPVAMAAVDAGRHVLVEEPLAANLSDGRELVAAAGRRRVVLMVDHTSCYTPAARHLRELVRGGSIGEPRYLESVRIEPHLDRPDIDVLDELAPHGLSILDLVLPATSFPVAIAAHGSDPTGSGRSAVAHLTVRLSTGAMAHVHVNGLSPAGVRTTTVCGSARTAILDERKGALPLAIYDRAGGLVAPALPPLEALPGVLAEFAAAITQRRAPLTPGASGLRVLGLLESAAASLRTGGGFIAVEPVMTVLGGSQGGAARWLRADR